jgi:hypothetical protein
MLEPITLGQPRTHCPGLAADERGVIMGKRLALFFPDLGRAVGFFRTYSREVSIDELLATLEIKESGSARGGREIMVRFEVTGSFSADRAAQAGRMHQGRVFTGTRQHFVPYRDRGSPLGYDVSSSEDIYTEEVDLVLYGEAGPDLRKLAHEIAFRDLILGLSPRPLTPREREEETPEALVLVCEKGISQSLFRYLWQRQISAQVSVAHSAERSLFTKGEVELHLIRCESMPKHVARLMSLTPGISVYVPVQPHLLVEWGHRHPIALEGCGKAFMSEDTVLFSGGKKKARLLKTQGDGVEIQDLIDVKLTLGGESLPQPKADKVLSLASLEMTLTLAYLPVAKGAVTALLIDMEKLSWFIKLVYMLPAAIVRTYEAVIAEDHIIVVNRQGVHGIPFGDPMTEVQPRVFIPNKMQLIPRVDEDVLRTYLNMQGEDNLYFFPEDGEPFFVPRDNFHPLSRAVVAAEQAAINLRELDAQSLTESMDPATILHHAQGVFSLWRGAKTTKNFKALPPADKGAGPT